MVEDDASVLPRAAASLSQDRPADRAAKLALVESFDGHARVRHALKEIAGLRDEWAGIPMPLDREQLIIEPRYPNAEALMAIGPPKPDRGPCAENADGAERNQDGSCRRCGADQGESCRLDQVVKPRNSWWSSRLRCQITIYEINGKVRHLISPHFNHVGFDLRTMGCSEAWGIEQESRALNLLATLVRHHQMKQYLLTGMFLERSRRSGLTYMFRKLKPTIVVDARDETDDTKGARIVAALCLHPIAFYDGSWAGAMAPTDDVIAHLMLMRGDEHLFWKRANQHPADRPEAGL